jgi:hypothetical protein
MRNAFEKFKKEWGDKTFNEILGCAKNNCNGLALTTDVDEYNNNTIACEVRYCPNYDKLDYDKSIIVEVVFENNKVNFNFSTPTFFVNKFGRRWEKILEFNKDEKNPRDDQYLWWEMLSINEGKFYMNNYDGEMVFVNNNGIEMLKCDF